MLAFALVGKEIDVLAGDCLLDEGGFTQTPAAIDDHKPGLAGGYGLLKAHEFFFTVYKLHGWTI